MNHETPPSVWQHHFSLEDWQAQRSDLTGIARLKNVNDRAPQWVRNPESLAAFAGAIDSAEFQPGHLMVDDTLSIALEFKGGQVYLAQLANLITEGGDHVLFDKKYAKVADTLREALD